MSFDDLVIFNYYAVRANMVGTHEAATGKEDQGKGEKRKGSLVDRCLTDRRLPLYVSDCNYNSINICNYKPVSHGHNHYSFDNFFKHSRSNQNKTRISFLCGF